MSEPKYITLTAASDGTLIRVRTDLIYAIHTANTRRTANFITGPDRPGDTVVTVSFGSYTVKETPKQVIRMMAGKPKGKS